MKTSAQPVFKFGVFVASAGIAPAIVQCGAGQVIFSQGDAADSIMYVQKGTLKLSVSSKVGREAVLVVLRVGDFFGEGCLSRQPIRTTNATAITRSVVLVIEKADMVRLLHTEPAVSDRFIEYMLERNIRLEADLVDQLVSSVEQRLARTLLLLARIGKRGQRAKKVVPSMSQSTLAEMVGSTRTRINFFMNKFERLGFIDRKGGLTVKRSLRRLVGRPVRRD